ncbi:MAG: hypothetical protein V4646_06810 [Pseudomonadota bacterium]
MCKFAFDRAKTGRDRNAPIRRRSVAALLGLASAAAWLQHPAFAQQPLDRRALVNGLQSGGFVVVHRYTGTTRSRLPRAQPGTIDDGQRLSSAGRADALAIGETYRRLKIQVFRVLSSAYFFVYEAAAAAFGDRIDVHRDLTGSLHFTDPGELDRSIAGLRLRVATPPAGGSNVVLWTHQGKFEKAFGYWLPSGETVVFRPSDDGKPHEVARLSFKEFVELTD